VTPADDLAAAEAGLIRGLVLWVPVCLALWIAAIADAGCAGRAVG
jgi:hypothetical protein